MTLGRRACQHEVMLVDHFPLLGLRLRTPRLELRLPDPEELAALGEVAAEGVHDPDMMPFLVPWTDQPAGDIVRSVVQHQWSVLGKWTPQSWTLQLSVFHEGSVVGVQELSANDLAITRRTATGSWLGRRHQGQGLGTEMRAAVLHLAFAGLDAHESVSSAFDGNHASHAVSRKLGYKPNGYSRQVVRGALTIDHSLLLTRADWERHRTIPVTIEGLAPCLPFFGVT